ncbi:unnamed protein product [Strongylus vulgaris]|uniref:ABC transporter domain-containing protein n=1 Tax=Strongylus vulgaris TaxID=40348 RepID=A0A3P7JT39_STRVU|nr:unnamed protein product [Strongylus vulgaris]
MFDDEDARELNLRHLRSHISLVGQEPTLFNYSIRENIAYGSENSTIEQIEEAAKLANAHDFITKLPEVCTAYIFEILLGKHCETLRAITPLLVKREECCLEDKNNV